MTSHLRISTLRIVSTSAVLIALIIVGCTRTPEAQPVDRAVVAGDTVRLTDRQRSTARLAFDTAQRLTLTTGLRATGMVHVPPQYAHTITAPYGGIVRSVQVLPGSRVKAGQTIAMLEDPEFITLQQEYLGTVAMSEAAEAELTRQARLAQDSVNARKRLDAASAEARTLRVRKRALAEKLALIHIDASRLTEQTLSRSVRIPAPISGYVTTVNVNTGSYVAPNQPLMEIVDTDHMHIELTIFERDVQKLRVGQPVTVSLTDAPDRTREAHIHLIGKDVRADRTVVVHAHLNTADPSLLPGTTLTAVVAADPRQSWVVPESAVVTFDGRSYVFTGTPEALVRRAVNVGITENGRTELLGELGWPAGTPVLVQGATAVLGVMTNKDE